MNYCWMLLVVLLFFFATSLADVERRCGHDRISKKHPNSPLQVVEEIPEEGEASWRTHTAASTEWRPIRFLVSALDVLDPKKFCSAKGQWRSSFDSTFAICRASDVLTPAKQDILLRELVPRALKLHSERLLVRPIQGRIRIPPFPVSVCSQFNVPTNHRTIGVTGVDVIIYVASGPTGDITAAWSSACFTLSNRRPIVGVMNYGPHVIEATEGSVRIAAHEIAHTLGFDVMLMGSLHLLRFVPNIRGQSRLLVGSAATLLAARMHYNCPSIRGMELENQGGQGTALSHWERRNAKDELMGGFGGTAGFYSAITMSVFEDMKFYKANWGMEENMAWGNNTGCAFLNEKCIVNGVTKFPQMFCTKQGPSRCTTDLRGLGTCRIVTYEQSLPPEFQYFASPYKGGDFIKLTDFCPYIDPITASRCHDGNVRKMPGSVVGPNSMCLEGKFLKVAGKTQEEVGDVCAEVICTDNTVMVRYAGNEKWHQCPEGQKLNVSGVFTQGSLVCPRHIDACHTLTPFTQKRKIVYTSADSENTLPPVFHSTALILLIFLFELFL